MSNTLRRLLTALAVGLAITLSAAAQSQELRIGMGADVTSMDPHFVNLFPNNNIAEHVFEKLITLDSDSRLIPGVAESWKAVDADDLGVQAAQGREVPRRLGLHRRGRGVLDRARRQDPRLAGAVHDLHQGDQGSADRRSAHDPLRHRRAGAAAAERHQHDLPRVEEDRDRRERPRTSTPARR